MELTGQFHLESVDMKPDKRKKIMQAAEKLFTKRRFHEITMDMVANAAGVGKGTIYRYFRDKNDVFFQVTLSGFDELCEIVRSEVPADTPFKERLMKACVQISGFFEGRRQLFRMIQSEEGRMYWFHGAPRERWMSQRAKLVGVVAEIIETGISEGLVRDDVPADVLAMLLLGMLRAGMRELGDQRQARGIQEFIISLFLTGVLKQGGAGEGPRVRGSVKI